MIESILVDPLSVKELSGISRRWQTYVGRGLYVALIGLVIWIFYTTTLARARYMSPSEFAMLGRYLFFSFLFLQLIVVTLSGVSSASDMITREVRGGTLGLLGLTPLSSRRIALGKWKAAMAQTVSAILCGLPVLAVCQYLGGVGLREVSYATALALAGAALGTALSLYYSTLFRTGHHALIAAVITLMVYTIAPTILFSISNDSERIMTILCYVHPGFAAGAAMAYGSFGMVPPSWEYGWIGATLCTVLLVLLLLRATSRRIRRLIRPPSGLPVWEPPPVGVSAPGSSTSRRTSGLARWLRGDGPVWERRAILWKELSARRVGTGKLMSVGKILLGFALIASILSTSGWTILMLWVTSIILLLVWLANGVSLFATEREERKWDILLSTPLRAWEIVFAKLAAGLVRLAPMALILGGFWATVGAFCGVSLIGGTLVAAAVGLMCLFAYTLGATASLFARTQRSAFSASFGILILLLFVIPLALGLMAALDLINVSGNSYMSILSGFNPAPFLSYASDVIERGRAGYRSARLEDWGITLASAFLFYGPLYAGLSAGLLAWMIGRFNRAAGRS